MSRELSMSAAIREVLEKILRENPEAFLIGEDIAVYGGAFKTTRGFIDEFGAERIVDTPISEAGIVSVACGAALMGSKPIVEIMFMDFMALSFDGIINIAVKWQEIYGDDYKMPVIIRSPAGAGRSYGPTHSQSFEGLLQNVPKLIIICPSNAADAAGLMLGAYQQDRPVIFIEHKALYARKADCPDSFEAIEIGKARKVREGDDITLIAYGRQVPVAIEAAEILEEKGIAVDLIDLRTVTPLDEEMILQRIEKTGRGISLEESPVIGGIGSEISALIMEKRFDYLEAPFSRLGAAEQAIPCNPKLETECFPEVDEIVAKAIELTNY